MSVMGPLDSYSFPFSNLWVQEAGPELGYSHPRIKEFCDLYPHHADELRNCILFDFILHHYERDFFSLNFPSKEVLDYIQLEANHYGDYNWILYSRLQYYEILQGKRNSLKNEIISNFQQWLDS